MEDSGHDSIVIRIAKRAAEDIAEIAEYSTQRWGEEVANRYVDDLESALTRLRAAPHLLRPEPSFHTTLCFYRVNKHVLVCDRIELCIYVLTVLHTAMDLSTRLAELEPQLALEAQLLHEELTKRET